MRILLILSLLSACATSDRADLGVEMHQQEASNWCWAATAQAVSAWSGADVTQTDVVSESLERECTTETCNVQFYPNKFLKNAGLNVVAFSYEQSTEDFWRAQLFRGVPIIALLSDAQSIGAEGGTVTQTLNHYIVVSGFTPEGFVVLDPVHTEPQVLPFAALQDYGEQHLHLVERATAFVIP